MDEGRFWVFDLDDTLYAEAEYVQSALGWVGDLVARLYGKAEAKAQLMALGAAGHADPIAAFWQNAALPEAAREAVVAGMRAHVPEIRLRPGAAAVLDGLRHSGVGFGIMTDGRSVTQRAKLAALGCLDARLILISGESGWQKPDVRCYGYFADRMPGLQFGYVGDNPMKDFVGAKAAGWMTVMLVDDGGNVHKQDTDVSSDHKALLVADGWEEVGGIVNGIT